MRTQTLLSGSAVALHYQSGPLEVSAAPHSLLAKSERSFPTPMGPAARRETWRLGGAQPEVSKLGGLGWERSERIVPRFGPHT